MDVLSPEESAKRVRAAAGFAGFKHPELERASGVKESRIRRLVAKSAPYRATREELQAIAAACGVPERFMLEGFAPMEESGLEQRLTALEQEVRRLGRPGAPGIPGETGRRLLDDVPSPGDQSPPVSRPAGDQRQQGGES